MPGARRQVGADVGVEPRVLHAVALVVVEPAAVGELAAHQPAVGVDRFVHQAAHGQRHGRLDVVPRVAVAALEPRDHAVGSLDGGDGVGRGEHVGSGQDPGHLGQRGRGGAELLGRHAAAPCLGVLGPRRPGTPRGMLGTRVGQAGDPLHGLGEVHHQALADERAEHTIGRPRHERRLDDVPHQHLVVRRDGRVARRWRARPGSAATSRASAGRARSGTPSVRGPPNRAAARASSAGRCARGRRACRGTRRRAPS